MRIIPVTIFIPDHLIPGEIHPCWKQGTKPNGVSQLDVTKSRLVLLPLFGQKCPGVELYHEFIFSDDWSEFDSYIAIELTIQSHCRYYDGRSFLRHCIELPSFVGFGERIRDYWMTMCHSILIDGGGSDVIDFDVLRFCPEHDPALYVMDYSKYKDIMNEVDRLLAEQIEQEPDCADWLLAERDIPEPPWFSNCIDE